MKIQEFMKATEDQAVLTAIREAEKRTSGEIRVVVSPRPSLDPQQDAFAAFAKLGMQETTERNGVLIFVAPATRKFAIVGDTGIHRCSGDGFWQEAADVLGAGFRDGRFSEALVSVIQQLGHQLARHFPRQSDDRNELPDSVVRD